MLSESVDTTDLLSVVRDADPQKTAAVFRNEVLSYGALARRACAVSRQLQDGPVLLLASNPLNALVGWLGCYHRGVTCAVIEPSVFSEFKDEICNRFQYTQLISDSDVFVPETVSTVDLRSVEEVSWTEAQTHNRPGNLVLATSRTTGPLKLVRHRYADLADHHGVWGNVAPLAEQDLVACHAKLSNAYVFNVAVVWALWSGRAICFVDDHGGRPHSLTTVSCLPVSYLQQCGTIKRLRLAVSAGQMIRNAEWDWFASNYPSVKLLNKVGATETLTCFLLSEDPRSFRLIAPYNGRVVDGSGDVVVGAPGRFEFSCFFTPSYVDQPVDSTGLAISGWTQLGDFAVDNGDGTFKFLGRNTRSLDLENAFRTLPDVRDCHYCEHEGMPALLIESPSMTLAEALGHARRFGAELPERRVVILESLRREPSGKLLAETITRAFSERDLPAEPASDGLPDIALAAVKNMWVRQMYFAKAGVVEDGHSHPIDHMTLLARGGLRVIVNNIATDYFARDGGKIIYIHKDVEHTLVALEDKTLAFCIHALREDNETEDIIDPDSIPAGLDALGMGIASPLIHGETVLGRQGRVTLGVTYR